MRYMRTVRIPLHYETDSIKLKKLDKITARLSSCVSMFLEIICKNDITTKSGLAMFEKDVQKLTKLSAGFVQQCRDKAVWMWKSYSKLHSSWERRIRRCKDKKYLEKLKKREPSLPGVNGKVPVRLDSRTVNIITDIKFNSKLAKPLKNDLVLSDFWLNLSTLVKGERVMLPLKLSNYHFGRLRSCEKIIDCEIVKKRKKYYAYLTCEYIAIDTDVKCFRTVDLGILRNLSTVLLDCDGNIVRNSFKVINNNQMQAKLNKVDNRIKVVQRQENWRFLKKLRAYRCNMVEDFMRKDSKLFAEHCVGQKVFIGYPKHIKYRHFKGNGNKKHRVRLSRWGYKKQISYLQHACESLGIEAVAVSEYLSSKRCNSCSNLDTKRPYKNNFSLFHCNDCDKTYNADFNSTINLGKKFITPQRSVMDGCGLNQQAIRLTAPDAQMIPLKSE